MKYMSGFSPVRQDLPANLGVLSCLVRKLICPVRLSPNKKKVFKNVLTYYMDGSIVKNQKQTLRSLSEMGFSNVNHVNSKLNTVKITTYILKV